jgi:hypothetical protein
LMMLSAVHALRIHALQSNQKPSHNDDTLEKLAIHARIMRNTKTTAKE